jgi:hypothetical protein
VTKANLGVNIEVNVKVNVDEHEKRNDQTSAQRACPGSAGTVSRKPSPSLVSGSLWACERSRVELDGVVKADAFPISLGVIIWRLSGDARP